MRHIYMDLATISVLNKNCMSDDAGQQTIFRSRHSVLSFLLLCSSDSYDINIFALTAVPVRANALVFDTFVRQSLLLNLLDSCPCCYGKCILLVRTRL